MPIYKAAVEFTPLSGFEEDIVVNTFTFDAPLALDNTNVGEISIPLAQMYNNDFGGANVDIARYLSPSISRAASAHYIKLYDITDHLDGSPHGSPVAVDRFTLHAAAAGDALPAEVALALTLRGVDWEEYPIEVTDGSDEGFDRDRPRQRRTGKVYFGPFNVGVLSTDGSGNARPQVGGIIEGLLDGAEYLVDQLAPNGIEWVIWSRKNEAVTPVQDVQVDDAFDTQRRRGAQPVVRHQRNVA